MPADPKRVLKYLLACKWGFNEKRDVLIHPEMDLYISCDELDKIIRRSETTLDAIHTIDERIDHESVSSNLKR
jgi:hypothetical protein